MQILTVSILQNLQQADLALMQLINRRWQHPLLDSILPWLREAVLWVPLYVFLVAWAATRLGHRALRWTLCFLLTVALSDQLSSGLLKPWIARPRPCRDPEVLPYIVLRLENCSGAFSFTSSHAANHFAIAMFVYITLHSITNRRWPVWLFGWAAAISYAQVYVGVHYPFDILGGTLVGLLAGRITGWLYLRWPVAGSSSK